MPCGRTEVNMHLVGVWREPADVFFIRCGTYKSFSSDFSIKALSRISVFCISIISILLLKSCHIKCFQQKSLWIVLTSYTFAQKQITYHLSHDLVKHSFFARHVQDVGRTGASQVNLITSNTLYISPFLYISKIQSHFGHSWRSDYFVPGT